MKIYQSISFAKRLIIYLLAVLIITFIFISLALTNSVQQFIGSNAHNQAHTFAGNIRNLFTKEILKIESIPDKITNIHEKSVFHYTPDLPVALLKTYSQLISCSIHYTSGTPRPDKAHIMASRCEDGTIQSTESGQECTFRPPAPDQAIRRSDKGGVWIFSEINQTKTIAFCYPFCSPQHQYQGFLKFDFPLQTITDIICKNKLYKFGYLFILDAQGNCLAHPSPSNNKQTIPFLLPPYDNHSLKQIIMRGETGSTTYYDNNTKYFIYYSLLSDMHWRLGIVCPFDDILNSSRKLYWIIFICLGSGLLFLFVGIINIVHRSSLPLKQLACSARQIAEGNFNADIPEVKSSKEINELYDSFRYMQRSLSNYIEKLKISTAEKEQRNTEMLLARRIQQRFLPHLIELPSNLRMAAALYQSHEVGGDLYEFFLLADRLYFVIGDVSGKGTPAALYMVSICKLFRYVASSHNSSATICNIINKHMCEDTEDDMYVTMFMGILDINTGIMTYTNAGHPYPLVVHDDGETNFLSKYPEVPIGILEDHCFTEHKYRLHKNTSLLFYTDGITDAENSAGQFYSIQNLIRCVQSVVKLSPDEIIQTILKDISTHIGKRNQSDDLTLLMIRFKGENKS